MKKILAFAMSALLAASAVVMPVSAAPAATLTTPPLTVSAVQAKPVSAEELAVLLSRRTEAAAVLTVESEAPTLQPPVTAFLAEASVSNPVEPPVLAQITASTAVLEYREGYEYQLNEGRWRTDPVFTGLTPNTEVRFRQRLAGNTDTVSEALTVTTLDRQPCSVTPAKPEVINYNESSISLRSQLGYEYRINGGSWKTTGLFSNLKPDTEYTLQQRVAQTDEEYASDPSEVLVFKTAHTGPSTYTNFTRMRQYIIDNGFTEDVEAPTIAYYIEADETTVYYFLISVHEYYAVCNVFSVTEGNTFLAFDTTFIIPVSGSPMSPETKVLYCYEGTVLEEARIVDSNAYIESYTDYSLNSSYCNSSYIPQEQMQDILNNTVAMLAGFWDEMLFELFGFGLKGLGFMVYDGAGDTCCHPSAHYHIGELISANQSTPTCTMAGKEPDQYCSLCGYKTVSGTVIPNLGGHRYDNDCDRDCNVCGETRLVTHRYSFACDVKCDICGAARTAPLADHSYGENRLCTKCGHTKRPIGDVSGDGNVNMGDVAKVYAHTRSASRITDPEELAAADVTGDGRINAGDVSKILAHVTGKKPLW